MIEYWPARCSKLEVAGKIPEASRCWWSAAEELRYATDIQIPADEVNRLRTQWLWRGARLALKTSRPGEPVHPSDSLMPGTTATPAPATSKKLAKAKSPKVKSSQLATSCGKPAAASVKVAALSLSAPMKKLNVTSRYQRRPRLLGDRRRQKTKRDCNAHWWTLHAASPGRNNAPGQACCGSLSLCILRAGASLVMEMIGAVVTGQGCRKEPCFFRSRALN